MGLHSRAGRPPTEAEMIQKLADSISIGLLRGTRLMSIKADVMDPQVAGELPNILISEYKALSFDNHRQISLEANDFLAGEVKRLSTKLEASKRTLQDYRERTHAVSLEGSRNIIDAQLRELNDKVTEAKTAKLKLEADYAQVQALKGETPVQLLEVASIANAPAVLEEKKNVTAQEAEFANLTQRYKSKHPKYIQAQGRLEELRAGLDRAIEVAANDLGNSVAAARATEEKFEQALHDQEGKSLDLGRLSIEYETLQRAVDSDTALYQSVLNRMNETSVTEDVAPQSIRVITRSAAPSAPAKPRKKFILALALLAGGMLGGGVALGRIAVDRSLHTVDQAESYLGLTILTSIPQNPTLMGKEQELPVIREQHGAIAENFRTLRTALHLLAPPAERRTFLITSAVPGEGKSFSAANLAIAFAQQGLRTLLIDGDMRMCSLHKLFFDNGPRAGVADVLLGKVRLEEAVRPALQNRLWLLTAGQRPERPAELLAGSEFSRLVSETAVTYDRIVIDSAPINAVSDTLLLVRGVDSVLLVVRAGRTARTAVAWARDKLKAAGAPLDGIVLNRLPPKSAGGYYYYSTGAYGEGVYGAPPASTT
jgi:capsular exopolysaccharide synthesis family protein